MNMAVKLPIKRPLRQALRRGDDSEYWKRLDLQFDRYDRDFDPRITYSGASARMYFDSAGELKYAPMNLGVDSEDIEAATWTSGTNITRGATTLAPPSPYSNSKSAMETAASGLHAQEGPAFTFVTGVTYTAAFVFSSIGGRNAEIGFPATVFTARFAKFTLSGAGAVFSTDAGVTASITALGSGFYLCKATSTCASGASARVSYFVNDASYARSYAGDITKGLYVTGYMLSLGSDQTMPYIPTTSAAVYLPRSNAYQDHDPSTLEPRGFLAEEARTNLALSNRDFRSAANGNSVTFWTNTNITVDQDNHTAPDGTLTGNLVTCDSNGAALTSASVTIASGASFTASFVAEKSVGDFVRIVISAAGSECNCWFNIATGATGSNDAGTGGIAFSAKRITPCGNGRYRVELAVTTTGITSINALFYNCSANSGSSVAGNAVKLWGAQYEVGLFATSLIYTTTAAATRLADSASITGAAFASIWNQSEGTIVVEGDSRSSSANAFTFQVDDGTSDNTLRMFHQTDEQAVFQVRTSGVSRFASGFGTVTDGAVYKAAAAFSSGSNAAALNGGAVTSNATAWTPSAAFTRIVIGNSQATEILNGHLQSLTIYRKRFPHTTLRSLATL